MNIQILPRLEPFDLGLVAFVEQNPHYRFLVTHGGKTNAPRTPRRLIALLQHQLQKKVPEKPGFRVDIRMSRDVHHAYSADGTSVLQAGRSHGIIVISFKDRFGILEIGFSDPNDIRGQVVTMKPA